MTRGISLIWVSLLLFKRAISIVMTIIMNMVIICKKNQYWRSKNNSNTYNNKNNNINNNSNLNNKITTLTNSVTCSHKRWVSRLCRNNKIISNNNNNHNIISYFRRSKNRKYNTKIIKNLSILSVIISYQTLPTINNSSKTSHIHDHRLWTTIHRVFH
mgnify:CR=1 FL=1